MIWVTYSIISPISAVCSGILLCALSPIVSMGGHPHVDNVFWMSSADFTLSLRYFIEYFFYHPSMKYGKIPCLISAFFGQFSIIATTSWYFVIGINIYFIFCGVRRQTLYRYMKLAHAYVWSVSLVCTLLPLYFGAYGPIEEDGNCWILHHYHWTRLFFIVPLGTYLIFSFGLLIFILRKSESLALITVRRKIVPFIAAFCVTWVWTLIADCWQYIPTKSKLPEYIRYLSMMGISATGFTNFLIWFILNDLSTFKKKTKKILNRCCIKKKHESILNDPTWEVLVPNLAIQDTFDSEIVGVLPLGTCIKGKKKR